MEEVLGISCEFRLGGRVFGRRITGDDASRRLEYLLGGSKYCFRHGVRCHAEDGRDIGEGRGPQTAQASHDGHFGCAVELRLSADPYLASSLSPAGFFVR